MPGKGFDAPYASTERKDVRKDRGAVHFFSDVKPRAETTGTSLVITSEPEGTRARRKREVEQRKQGRKIGTATVP